MYDAIIIGCGPAGLTAGIYLARAGKKVVIFEKETVGGQMSTSPLIENYPGYESISGSELAFNMYNQSVDEGVQIEIEEVLKVEPNKVITDLGEYKTKVVIVATGAKYRKLSLPNEENLIGKGIHFCTACDGSFYKDKVVAVIGGANSAVTNVIYLSNICKKVYLIYRNSKLKCEKKLEDKLNKIDNIEVLYNTNVKEINGEDSLESILVENKDSYQQLLLIDGMFESIGVDAQTEIVDNLLEMDDKNYLIHQNTKTKYDNIFVIGDCSSKEVRQITTAINDGAIAATYAINYLNKED